MLTSSLVLLWVTFLHFVVGTTTKRQSGRTTLSGTGQLGGTFYYNFEGPLGETCHAQVTFTIQPGNGRPSVTVGEVWCNTRLGNTRIGGSRAYTVVRDRGGGATPSFQNIELGLNIPNQALVLAQGLYRFNGATPRITANVNRDTGSRFAAAFRLLFNNPVQGAACMADASGQICGRSLGKRDPQRGFAQPVEQWCYARC